MSISARQRWRVLERWGFRCGYCGKRGSDESPLQVDHVRPKAKGGTDAPDNLMASCRDCNFGKTDSLIDIDHLNGPDALTDDALTVWFWCFGPDAKHDREAVYNWIAVLGIDLVKYHMHHAFAIKHGVGAEWWLETHMPQLACLRELDAWNVLRFMCCCAIDPEFIKTVVPNG